jgi:hypothetical protein
MGVALVGAALEENLGLEYMAAALEQAGHEARIIPYNTDQECGRPFSKSLPSPFSSLASRWCSPGGQASSAAWPCSLTRS